MSAWRGSGEVGARCSPIGSPLWFYSHLVPVDLDRRADELRAVAMRKRCARGEVAAWPVHERGAAKGSEQEGCSHRVRQRCLDCSAKPFRRARRVY